MSYMNEGTADRAIRVLLGVALLVLGFTVVGGAWGVVFDVVGVIALATGAVGWCPLYAVFGFRTAEMRTEDRRAVTKVG